MAKCVKCGVEVEKDDVYTINDKTYCAGCTVPVPPLHTGKRGRSECDSGFKGYPARQRGAVCGHGGQYDRRTEVHFDLCHRPRQSDPCEPGNRQPGGAL